MSIPSNSQIHEILNELDRISADELESHWLDFKPWTGAKSDMKTAVEYAACFANADGGVIVFGVADHKVGRSNSIHGCSGYDLDIWQRGIFDSTRPNLRVAVEELSVPEGTGHLLVVRVPKGNDRPYGTAQGLFQERVGKNCMPMDSRSFAKARFSTGELDWSGEISEEITRKDLDPVEISRGRNILRRFRPQSELNRLSDDELLVALNAVRKGGITRTGLLLFGREQQLSEVCPQHQLHYVHQPSELQIARNDSYKCALLQIIEQLDQLFLGPSNPEYELSVGLFKLRIPAFPIDVVREAVLNAITHRDYANSGEVLIRHTASELIVTSPGGFVPGISAMNILRHEPVARNRTLAEALEKLGLVERAGVGRRRIFNTALEFGKRIPHYETDGNQVTLRIFDGTFDERMARLVAKWKADGRQIDLDQLLILSYLREHAFIDTDSATTLLQLNRDETRGVLDTCAQPRTGILERKGTARAATYHLAKTVAKDLLGKAAYTRLKGINPIRFPALVREFVWQHDSITPAECRELLGLGNSPSARVEVSQYLREWSGPEGFLDQVARGRASRYRLRRRESD
ncbi:MAG: putative DNA binding domain-containing protein [Pirellulales bacterium]